MGEKHVGMKRGKIEGKMQRHGQNPSSRRTQPKWPEEEEGKRWGRNWMEGWRRMSRMKWTRLTDGGGARVFKPPGEVADQPMMDMERRGNVKLRKEEKALPRAKWKEGDRAIEGKGPQEDWASMRHGGGG
jgi:hypothetical protein